MADTSTFTARIEAEIRVAREGAGFVRSPEADYLVVTGDDRLRFLNGMLTCDVKSLQQGQGAYGFVVTAQGKIMADAVILATVESLSVQLPAGTGTEIKAHLEKYVITDQVEIEVREDLAEVLVLGPGAAAAVAGALESGRVPDVDWSHARGVFAGGDVRWVSRPDIGTVALGCRVSATRLAEVGTALIAVDIQELSAAALEVLRLEAGEPRFGVDYGVENLPQETGLAERAVSFTKGCYLGQEVIARIHYRGKVNRELRGLVFEPGSEVEPGAEVSLAGETVGTVTSIANSLRLGCPIGLSLIHRKAGAEGERLDVTGGLSAHITALPFVSTV